MSDTGIKFAKDGKTIESTDPDDYNFWTKYPPLNLLEKKTVTITSTTSVCEGTEVVNHDYDFVPMVLGTVRKTTGPRYFMPSENFAPVHCDYGTIPVLRFGYAVFDSKVEVYWMAYCALMGSQYCPLSDQVFYVDLYFYLFELGKEFP